jgi:ABC-type polysaccharide/polyol phosphate transport system ATPase subunit
MNPETPLKGLRSVLAPANRTLDHTSTRAKTSGITKLETRIGQLLALTHALKTVLTCVINVRAEARTLQGASSHADSKARRILTFTAQSWAKQQVESIP